MVFKIVFWFSLFIIFYSYLGYGILIYVIVRIKRLVSRSRVTTPQPGYEPEVTLVIAAFNEEDFIETKIANTFELDYPEDKLKLIFITDGSSDGTAAHVQAHPRIEWLHKAERRGKVAAMNRAMTFVKTPLVIFCDANTLLNRECVREIVKHYADPLVGGVAGEKKIHSLEKDQAAGAGEGIYWKYESLLKKFDSELYSVVGAAGELFSVRTSLFHEALESTVIEDFVQSLQICLDGYVVRYEPAAYAIETASASMKEEQKRKIRITAGAFQAMLILKKLFNPFPKPVLTFQFISHRILRWTLCPLCLFLLFISNAWLVYHSAGPVYTLIFWAQVAFYVLAWTGWAFASRNISVKALYVPYYFMFMNLSVYLGFLRFLRGSQSAVWDKALRHNPKGQVSVGQPPSL